MTDSDNIKETNAPSGSVSEKNVNGEGVERGGKKKSKKKVDNRFAPIYISYSSGKSNRTGQVQTDKITGKTQEDLACDKVKMYLGNHYSHVTYANLEGGESIMGFEDGFKKCKIVVVILSNEYLYSPHCMYEWSQMHKSHKTIIYLKVNNYHPNEKIITKYWMYFFRKNIKNVNDKSLNPITKEALKNNCYLSVIKKFWEDLKNDVMDEISLEKDFELSYNNIQSVNKTIKKENDSYDEIINCIKDTSTILIVGDFILNDRTGRTCRFEEEKDMELAIQGLLDRASDQKVFIREYNRNVYKQDFDFEHEAFKRINLYSANYFKDLLETDMFDTIVSVSFSKEIDKAVEEYVYKRKIKRKWFVLNENGRFAPDKSRYDETMTPVCRELKIYDAVSVEKCYSLVTGKDKSSIKKEGRIIFAEKDVVDFTVKLINAMSSVDVKDSFTNKCVLALGTNFPGWSLRFICSSLYLNEVNASFMSNRPVDGKTEFFLRKQKGNFKNFYKIDEDFIPDFVKKLKRLRRKKIINKLKKENDEKQKQSDKFCYLYYLQAEKSDYLQTKTKFGFLWNKYSVIERRDSDTIGDIEVNVSKSELVVIYNSMQIDLANDSFENGLFNWLMKITVKNNKLAILLYKDTDNNNSHTKFVKNGNRLCISEDLSDAFDRIIKNNQLIN